MSEITLTDRDADQNIGGAPTPSAEIVEEKEYVEPDPSQSTRCASFDEFLQDFFTDEEIEEIHSITASQSVGSELASMRIRAGISQKMMAAALGVSQPRISAIETAPNSKASWKAVQQYVSVTGTPFKAVLEDGSFVTLTRPGQSHPRPRNKKAAELCV